MASVTSAEKPRLPHDHDGAEIALRRAYMKAACKEEAAPEPGHYPSEPTVSPRKDAGRLHTRILTFPAVLVAGIIVVTLFTISNRFNDPDLWWHLKVGETIWTTRSIPASDMYSFTAHGHPWIDHEWLAQWSLYGAYAAGGYTGLMLWFAVFACAIFVLVYAVCWLRTGNALISFLGGLMAWFFGTSGLAVRPLILGHLFLALEFLILELARARSRRWLWALPPLFAIWVNCHGSYYFGLGVLGVYLLCSRLQGRWGLLSWGSDNAPESTALVGTLALSAVALCLNPLGPRLLLYPFNMLFQQPTNIRAVQEWLPPDPASERGAAMILCAFAVLAIPVLRRAPLRMRDAMLAGVAFWMAVLHFRMLFLFGIVVAPILAGLVAPLLPEGQKRNHPVVNALLLLSLAVSAVLVFPGRTALEQQVRKGNPAAAIEYIKRAGLRGPMLNEYVFGGYLIWALPSEPVFIDGRGDLFEWTGVFADYGRWYTVSEDPNKLLNRYGIRLCLLSRDASIAQLFPFLGGWKRVYSDKMAVIFAR